LSEKELVAVIINPEGGGDRCLRNILSSKKSSNVDENQVLT